MKKINKFLYVFKNTFSSPEYYKHVLKAPFSFSLKFFLAFFILYSVAVTSIFSFTILPELKSFTDKFPQVLLSLYPDDLVLSIENGKMQKNTPEPVIVKTNTLINLINIDISTDEYPENLIIIDEKVDVDRIDDLNTIAILSREKFGIHSNDNEIRIYSLSDISNFYLNEDSIRSFVSSIKPWILFIPFIAVIIVFISSFVLSLLSNLIYMVFTALALYLLSKLFTLNIGYQKIYQINLHLAVITTTIFFIINNFVPLGQRPFLELVIQVLLSSVIFYTLRKSPKYRIRMNNE